MALSQNTQNGLIKVALAVAVLTIMYFAYSKLWKNPKKDDYADDYLGDYVAMGESYVASEPEDLSAEGYGEDEEETFDDGASEEAYGEDEEDYGEEEEAYGDEEEEYGEEEEEYGEHETYEEETYGEEESETYDDMNEGFSIMEPTVDEKWANALFTAPAM